MPRMPVCYPDPSSRPIRRQPLLRPLFRSSPFVISLLLQWSCKIAASDLFAQRSTHNHQQQRSSHFGALGDSDDAAPKSWSRRMSLLGGLRTWDRNAAPQPTSPRRDSQSLLNAVSAERIEVEFFGPSNEDREPPSLEVRCRVASGLRRGTDPAAESHLHRTTLNSLARSVD
jgi:hypothetical protein